jgi:hypothetical protein
MIDVLNHLLQLRAFEQLIDGREVAKKIVGHDRPTS